MYLVCFDGDAKLHFRYGITAVVGNVANLFGHTDDQCDIRGSVGSQFKSTGFVIIMYYDGAYYFGVSYETNDSPVVRFAPETNEYCNIHLYKNDTDVIASLQNNENINYKRVSDLFNVNGRLYCALSVSYTDGKVTIEFFKMKDNRFEFCQAFKGSGMQVNKLVKNQLVFNADAVIGNSCYISLGNLYKTDDFVHFSKISIPGNACVTDLWVDKSNGKEALYALTTIENDSRFDNTIYRLDGEQLTEVFSFDYSCSALSFAKDNKYFYVSLGGDGAFSNDIGRVLKVELF